MTEYQGNWIVGLLIIQTVVISMWFAYALTTPI